jgi:hypothetical protein
MNDERQAFEALMARLGYHLEPATYRDGTYRDTEYSAGWAVWQAARAASPVQQPPMLDDEGRAMIVNSHHYTAANIQAIIDRLKAFADPEQTALADWDKIDWRGECNVWWRVMSGLFHGLEPAQPPTPQPPQRGTARAADLTCCPCSTPPKSPRCSASSRARCTRWPRRESSPATAQPRTAEPMCPACGGSGVIQTHDSIGLVDQMACDLCGDRDA